MTADLDALRIVITDDEAPARSRLRDLLSDCAEQLPLEVVGEAANGRELVNLLQDQPADLVLLDIRMPDMDGLEAARHLQRLPEPPKIIFTTAYDTYAVKAFELHAVDYLLKPIRGNRLLDAISRARALTPLRVETLQTLASSARTHLAVSERGRIILVPVPDILYLRAELKYVSIRTRDRELLMEESLTKLEQEFGDRFVRIHRNCLVARAHVTGFERAGIDGGEPHWTVALNGLEERLPVSRRQVHVVKEFGRMVG